jgi:hypothetical protein
VAFIAVEPHSGHGHGHAQGCRWYRPVKLAEYTVEGRQLLGFTVRVDESFLDEFVEFGFGPTRWVDAGTIPNSVYISPTKNLVPSSSATPGGVSSASHAKMVTAYRSPSSDGYGGTLTILRVSPNR